MITESLKAVRSTMMATLFVCVLWLVSWPSVTETLSERARAKHLVTWLLLKEFGEKHEFFATDPVEIIPPWPYKKLNLTFSRERSIYEPDLSPRFTVSSDTQDLPFGDYEFSYHLTSMRVFIVPERNSADVQPQADREVVKGITKEEEEFIETNAVTAIVQIKNESLKLKKETSTKPDAVESTEQSDLNPLKKMVDGLPRDGVGGFPSGWRETTISLGRYTDANLHELGATDAAVQAYIRDAEQAKYSLFGLSMNAGLFYLAPGAFFGLSAFLLLGPVLAIRERQSEEVKLPWVMALRQTSVNRRWYAVAETGAFMLCAVWVALPLVVLTLQATAHFPLSSWEKLAFWLNLPVSLIASISYAWASWRLYQLRATAIDECRPTVTGEE